jgi:diguanylate cyclase (GGDEF)-like protein/PAS domain S-box-containing protein
MQLQLFKTLIDSTTDPVFVTDARPQDLDGPRIEYANPALEKFMGYRAGDLIGQSTSILHGPDTDPATLKRIRAALHKGKGIRTEILHYGKDGQAHWLDMNVTPLRDATGVLSHFAFFARDIHHVKMIEQQLAKLALIDSLTGTLNRPALHQQADKEFTRSKRYHRPLSVIMLDIDHFKQVNDRYGHQAGDQVLQIFAEACQEIIRSTDLLGRVGGEEFAILLPDTPSKAACHLAERLRQRITKYPYLAGDMLIEVTASLGVAELQPGDADFKALLQRADEALYLAKHGGRNQVTLAA